MAVSLTVFVGSYLRVLESLTVITVDLCADHDRGDGNHCPDCGRTASRRFREHGHRKTDDFWDDSEWVDRLVKMHVDDDGYRAVSNYGKGHISISRDAPDGVWDMPRMATAEAEFLAEHQPEVDRLRELGCVVSIEFGVLSWTS